MNTQELFDLTDRVAIVTGGGTHLGREMAATLCELGATVHIASRNLERLEQSAIELRAKGFNCAAHQCDASNERDVSALIENVMRRDARLDIMVCNAGAVKTGQQAPNITTDEWSTTLRLCLDTAFLCAQAAAKVMIERRGGRIITIGSIHGFLGPDLRSYAGAFKRAAASYHASKGAVIQLTKSLACELGQYGVTVNCISPGQIPPPQMDALTVEQFRRANPLGTTGSPEHLKGVLALLASDAGKWITGQNIVVDGGWSVW